MQMSNMFSRCDGLDAMIAMDPTFSSVLDDIDDKMNVDESGSLVRASLIEQVLMEEAEEELEDSYGDEIDNVDDGSYVDGEGVDPVDMAADEIHDMEVEADDIGEMIDSLMAG